MRLLITTKYEQHIKTPAMKYNNNNATLTAVASIAGLAIGAALGILFAPKSGRDIRSKLKFGTSPTSRKEDDLFTGHPLEDLWETTRDHADHLQGPEKKRRDTSRIKVPSAGTLAWSEESKQPWKENNYTEGHY
jgi:gas vesicle protein